TFLKRMCNRYGQPSEGSILEKVLKSPINLLSVIFSQIYFPGFSNGLKDTVTFLGFKWADENPSGLQSIACRHLWEGSHDALIKEKLIRYNEQDCEALNLVADTIQKFHISPTIGIRGQDEKSAIVHADSDQFPRRSKWRVFTSPVSNFEYINSAAQ